MIRIYQSLNWPALKADLRLGGILLLVVLALDRIGLPYELTLALSWRDPWW